MTTELLSASRFLRQQFPDGGRVLCAVSGGLDSMCLLEFLRRQSGFNLTVAHFNHCLRGENADRDEAFVRKYCAGQEIACVIGRGDVRALAATGMSVEEAARVLRYDFLQKTAAERGCEAIFTAHHADDNAETILLNLIRGTGSAGLAGIPQVRGNICRPFLQISREKLEAYAKRFDIPHVEDETNLLDIAARNVLRRRVLPVLKELNSAAVENMSSAAGILSRESRVLEDLAEELMGHRVRSGAEISISRALLLKAPPAVAERAVLRLLEEAAGQRKNLTAAHVEAVLQLAGTDAAEQISLPYGLIVRRYKDVLRLCRCERLPSMKLELNCPVRWGDYTLTLLDHPAGDGVALKPGASSLTVAPCPAGGRLTLPGARGARTVKRLCADCRISTEERDRLPAIYEEGHLAAVWKLGVDQSFLPEGTRCRFIQITIL